MPPAAPDPPALPTPEPGYALAERTTATLLKVRSRQAAKGGLWFVGGLAVTGEIALDLPAFPAGDTGAVLALAGFWGAAALMFGAAVRIYSRVGRGLFRARRLLAGEVWQPVRAESAGGDTVKILDGTNPGPVRATGIPDAVCQVIGRTGRVWMVGPDDKGWLVIRIDGSRTPWPARRVGSYSPPTVRPPETRETTGTAADEPVTEAWAATVVRRARRQYRGFLVSVVVVLAMGPAMGVVLGSVGWSVVLTLYFMGVLTADLDIWRRLRDQLALPRLLRAGPWSRVEIELDSWVAAPTGEADATCMAVLGDGRAMLFALRAASLDLLATMAETRSVWVAGEPERGRKMAVGFPGYPLLGVARLS